MNKLKCILHHQCIGVNQLARIAKKSKSTISELLNAKYNGKAEALEAECLRALESAGYKTEFSPADTFIRTVNVERIEELIDELETPASDYTSTLGVVIGRAGRGKTSTLKRIAAQSANVHYVYYVDGYSLVDVARELCFEVSSTRPAQFRSCRDALKSACEKDHRVFIIDEADKMPMRTLEMLRSLNEYLSAPIILSGEEPLQSKLLQERRLTSRVRRTVVCQQIIGVEISAYYRLAYDTTLEADVIDSLYRRSGGDWRPVIRDAGNLQRILRKSKSEIITKELVQKLS